MFLMVPSTTIAQMVPLPRTEGPSESRKENDSRIYFMISLQESMGPGQDGTHDPWISNQTCKGLWHSALQT